MSKRSRPTSSGEHAGRQRRQVLGEDEYTATLASIVQRDYFPDLPNLERQSASLERRVKGDMAGSVAVRRATQRLANHEAKLAAREADDEHDLEESANVRRRARPLHQESITGFHARVTNEDDEDFNVKQKKSLAENRERLEKIYRPEEDSKRGHVPRLGNMASDEFDAESNWISASEWNKPKVRSALFLPPTPLIHQSDAHQSGDVDITRTIANGSTRHCGQALSNHQVSLTMPPPGSMASIKSSLALSGNGTILPKHTLVEYVPKHVLEKKIEPSQTRFPDKIVPLVNRSLANPTGERSDDSYSDDDSDASDSTDLDATPLRSVEQERRSRQRHLDRTRNTYVAMTPLLTPTAGEQSPITTWGTIDSTPVVLSGQERNNKKDDAEEESNTIFSLVNNNDRDRAARKAEKELARRAKRAKTPKRSVKDSLTPAARSLLAKTRRTPSRPRNAFASALRSSYTPKSSRPSSTLGNSKYRTNSSSRRQVDSAHNATPLISRKQQS